HGVLADRDHGAAGIDRDPLAHVGAVERVVVLDGDARVAVEVEAAQPSVVALARHGAVADGVERGAAHGGSACAVVGAAALVEHERPADPVVLVLADPVVEVHPVVPVAGHVGAPLAVDGDAPRLLALARAARLAVEPQHRAGDRAVVVAAVGVDAVAVVAGLVGVGHAVAAAGRGLAGGRVAGVAVGRGGGGVERARPGEGGVGGLGGLAGGGLGAGGTAARADGGHGGGGVARAAAVVARAAGGEHQERERPRDRVDARS